MKCKGCGAELSFQDLAVKIRGDRLGVTCPNCKSFIQIGLKRLVPMSTEMPLVEVVKWEGTHEN